MESSISNKGIETVQIATNYGIANEVCKFAKYLRNLYKDLTVDASLENAFDMLIVDVVDCEK